MNQDSTYYALGDEKDVSTGAFQTSESSYATISCEHAGEFNLRDDINAEEMKTQSKGSIIRIRRLGTDALYPWDGEMFVEWFANKPIDPETREDLSYLARRVAFKKECIQPFKDITFNMITTPFKKALWERARWLISEKLLREWTREEALEFLKACNFVDIQTLEACKIVHKGSNMNFDKAKKVLKDAEQMSWLMRLSSQHKRTMPNSDVVCLAFKTMKVVEQEETGFELYIPCVSQYRMVHVHGVGWYNCDGNVPLTSFKAMSLFINRKKGIVGSTPPPPNYVTIVHWLKEMSDNHFISMDRCIEVVEGVEGVNEP